MKQGCNQIFEYYYFSIVCFQTSLKVNLEDFLLNFMDPRIGKSDTKSSTVSTLGIFWQCLNFGSYPRTDCKFVTYDTANFSQSSLFCFAVPLPPPPRIPHFTWFSGPVHFTFTRKSRPVKNSNHPTSRRPYSSYGIYGIYRVPQRYETSLVHTRWKVDQWSADRAIANRLLCNLQRAAHNDIDVYFLPCPNFRVFLFLAQSEAKKVSWCWKKGWKVFFMSR